MAVEFSNLTKRKINTKKLGAFAAMVLAQEGKPKADASVVLVPSLQMRGLNKRYRGKDAPANVLSFPVPDHFGPELSSEGFGLGEIVLCPSVIRKDAVEYKLSFQQALSWMLVHGLLHLLGAKHETQKDEKNMKQKEQRYLSLVR